jgi:hypothetical protein
MLLVMAVRDPLRGNHSDHNHDLRSFTCGNQNFRLQTILVSATCIPTRFIVVNSLSRVVNMATVILTQEESVKLAVVKCQHL